jgi:hypothetical protein
MGRPSNALNTRCVLDVASVGSAGSERDEAACTAANRFLESWYIMELSELAGDAGGALESLRCPPLHESTRVADLTEWESCGFCAAIVLGLIDCIWRSSCSKKLMTAACLRSRKFLYSGKADRRASANSSDSIS